MSNPSFFSVRLLALAFAFLIPGSSAWSQSLSLEEIKWAASCVQKADASLHITDFGHVWKKWNRQPCFESDEYRSVVDFLFEQNGDFSKTIDDVNSVLESTESFHLFLTMPKEKGELDFLAFFKVEEADEDVASVFVAFLEQAMSIKTGERSSGRAVAITNKPLFHTFNNNWIVVGTSEDAVADSSRIMNIPFEQRTKSLATRRQFLRLLNGSQSRGNSFFVTLSQAAAVTSTRSRLLIGSTETGFRAFQSSAIPDTGNVLNTLPFI